MQRLLLIWVTGKQHDYSGAIRATIVRGLELGLKRGSRLGLVREDLAHAARKYSSDFSMKRRPCVVLIKQENVEDTGSILSAEKQPKKPFVTSLVPVAFCQLLIRISRVGMGKLRPSSVSIWKLPSRVLRTTAPRRALLGLQEKAWKRQVRGPQSSWSCFEEGER